MPNTEKRSAGRVKNKKELQVTGNISVPGEILPWERDLLEPVIKALHADGGLADGTKAEEPSDG